MSGLIIKLSPHEQIMINGVLIENGDRKSRLRIVTDNARIIRRRDMIEPAEATTPLKRAHYIAQRVISGDMTASDASTQIRLALSNNTALPGPDSTSDVLLFIEGCIADNDFYRALKYLRTKTAPIDEP